MTTPQAPFVVVSESQAALCLKVMPTVQNVIQELTAMREEPTFFAIDLQSFVPPLQKIQQQLGQDLVWQPLCAALFSWQHLFGQQKSNRVFQTKQTTPLFELGEHFSSIVDDVQTKKQLNSVKIHALVTALESLEKILSAPEEPKVTSAKAPKTTEKKQTAEKPASKKTAAEKPPKPPKEKVAKKVAKEKAAPEAEPIVATAAPAANQTNLAPVATGVSEQPAAPRVPEKTAVVPVLNPKLASIFLEEADELLITLQEALSEWQNAPQNVDLCTPVRRDLHTFKGASRTVGLSGLSQFIHELENITSAIEHQKLNVSDAVFSLLQKGLDRISLQIDKVKQSEPMAPIDDVLAEITRLLASVPAEESVAPLPEKPVTEVTPVQLEQKVEPLAEQTPSAPAEVPEVTATVAPQAPDVAPVATAATSPSTPTEVTLSSSDKPKPNANAPVVRVKTEVLEKFANWAGVANISRVNLEEEVTHMSAYVNAVVDSVGQLRTQIRELAQEARVRGTMQAKVAAAVDAYAGEEPEADQRVHVLAHALEESADNLQTLQVGMQSTLEQTGNWLIEQQKATDALQEGLTSIRMEPFSTMVPRLERLVRQVSNDLKKEVDFTVEGQEKECDRKMIDRLLPSLEHMLRNSLDHGIEPAEERLQYGKPAKGHITLSLMQTGSELILTLKDDGRGIDTDRVRKKAEEMGWLKPGEAASEDTLFHFILKPGFSTSEKITQISGRGVGMDVVSTEVAELSGALTMESTLHKGAMFKIVLPFTLSLSRVLLFAVEQQWYGLQLANIEGIVRVPYADCQRSLTEKTPFVYADRTYALSYLGAVLKLNDTLPNTKILPVLLLRVGDKRLAFVVDSLVGTREVVIHTVGPQLRAIRVLNGAAILGDGKVVLVLDALNLMQNTGFFQEDLPPPPKAAGVKPNILVVDDSLTVRTALTEFLIPNNYQPATAEDGREALLKMRAEKPDLVLLDLEMPHMDGFEVISYMRATTRWREIPIIVISSRASEKNKALALGANQFFEKPYNETELLAAIQKWVGH